MFARIGIRQISLNILKTERTFIGRPGIQSQLRQNIRNYSTLSNSKIQNIINCPTFESNKIQKNNSNIRRFSARIANQPTHIKEKQNKIIVDNIANQPTEIKDKRNKIIFNNIVNIGLFIIIPGITIFNAIYLPFWEALELIYVGILCVVILTVDL